MLDLIGRFFPNTKVFPTIQRVDPQLDGSERGRYFSRKKPDHFRPLPDYKGAAHLPTVVLPESWPYSELYWKAWQLAFTHLKTPSKKSPLVANYIDAAFSNCIFQWDTIFILGFMKYADSVFPAIESLDNFYSRQHQNGYICRELRNQDGRDVYFMGAQNSVNPPLFAWAETEHAKFTGKRDRYSLVYPALVKYAEWLEIGRKAQVSRHGLYWNTGLGCGMDNTPRSGSGWVDMSCQMVMMYQSLAEIAQYLGDEKTTLFKHRAEDIASRIQKYMWNEEEGFYFDVDDQGVHNKRKTIAGFWPLLAGLATENQVRRLMGHLKNPKSFWRPHVFPSLAADDPGYTKGGLYWRGSVWAPTNVMVIKGLARYASIVPEAWELAGLATKNHLEALLEVYRNTGTIWENYSPEKIKPGSWSKKNFVGWSGCGPIQLLIETGLGFDADGAKRVLTWCPRSLDRQGILNFVFGDITTSLMIEKGPQTTGAVQVEYKSTGPYLLKILIGNKAHEVTVQKGEGRIELY